jgi:hypothetical protein
MFSGDGQADSCVMPEVQYAVAGENVRRVKDEAYKNSILTAAREDVVLRDRLTSRFGKMPAR